MAADIKSEMIASDGQSALLVSIKNGEGIIGTCTAGRTDANGSPSGNLRLFYIGNEPIINLICPNRGNPQSDKLVSFSPGFVGYDKKINDALTDSFKRLNEGESLTAGLREIFVLLEDGIYTVYLADYYPTDGAGIFFWGGYNISHEVHGTAERNHVIGDRTYKPCFLLPTQPMDYFAPRVKAGTDEQVKRRKVQGIVYHVSGLYSALLKGHHGAVCCCDQSIPFTCAVIEKIAEPYTEKLIFTAPEPAPPPEEKPEEAEATNISPEGIAFNGAPEEEVAPEGEGEPEPAPEPEPEPVIIPDELLPQRGITGFRSPSVKIPLEIFPKDMLRQILEGRSEYKPKQFNVLASKLQTMRRKSVNNNVLPYTVLEKAEQMPDCEMIESAYAIDSLSDEQLNALLSGEIEYDGKLIVNANYYSSVITACNYLQFKDPKRFVDFAISVIENPELFAAHEYTARRLANLSDNKKVFSFFQDVVVSADPKYDKILVTAQVFVKRFKEK